MTRHTFRRHDISQICRVSFHAASLFSVLPNAPGIPNTSALHALRALCRKSGLEARSAYCNGRPEARAQLQFLNRWQVRRRYLLAGVYCHPTYRRFSLGKFLLVYQPDIVLFVNGSDLYLVFFFDCFFR